MDTSKNSLLLYYKNVLKISIAVTPGIPTTADIASDNKLIGKVTPVKTPKILTAAKVAMPFSIEKTVFLSGFFALTIICIKNSNKNIIAQNRKVIQLNIKNKTPF